MSFPFVILFLGFLAIFIEFYLPGGLMAIIGVCLILLSILWFAWISSSPLSALMFAALAIALLIPLFKFTLWRIKSSRKEWSIYSNADQQGFQASTYDKELIGSEGIALTDLRPSGKIVIKGKNYQAMTQGEYIEKGSIIVIIGGQESNLIIKEKNK